MEQGNNIECLKTFRMNIPLYNEQSIGQPGIKYFFPDNPIFNGKNIVGIDLNCTIEVVSSVPPVFYQGDLRDTTNTNGVSLIGLEAAKYVYCTIYEEDNTEKFFNTPLRSFFPSPSYLSTSGVISQRKPRRVKPYYGKINPRKSYLFIPVGTTQFPVKTYVSLTFYYN
jgi:hypothetical protein